EDLDVVDGTEYPVEPVAEMVEAPGADTDAVGDEIVVAEVQVAAVETVPPEEAAPVELRGVTVDPLPRPAPPPQIREVVIAAPEPDPPVIRPAQAETYKPVEATFIVKFKPDPAIDDVIAGWRMDREAAKAGFEAWASGDPVFGDMTLEGCSYSGELLLARRVEAPTSSPRQLVSALTSDIRGHSAVAYADPDFTAHPGTSSEDE
ncbi:MAG: hypothetical protein AAF638_06565, partial [Pseudomonadota bacterium]